MRTFLQGQKNKSQKATEGGFCNALAGLIAAAAHGKKIGTGTEQGSRLCDTRIIFL